MEAVIVNLAGLALAAFIAAWFWWPRRAAQAAPGGRAPVDVVVADGVYSPSRIAVPAGQALRLRFIRRDRSPCAGVVQFPALGISRELPVDAPVLLELPPLPPGEHAFACQMNMYRGTVVAQ